MITFDPFWETIKQKNISQYALIQQYHVKNYTLDRLRHNKNVTLETIDYLCEILDCNVEDIISHTPDK